MNRPLIVLALIAGLGAPGVASAQSPTTPRSTSVARSVAGWTAAGAGAGFGLGFYLGFRAFDQATYAERKIMTSAIVGAAAGALGGYLVGRMRRDSRRPAAPITRAAVTGAEVDTWLPVSGAFTLHGTFATTGARAASSDHHDVR